MILAAGTAALLASLAAPAQEVSPMPDTLQAVSFEKVSIEDRFWLPRIRTNREVTLEANLAKCAETGRLRNFAVAGGLVEGEFEGRRYNDSDVYKVLEGAAYTLAQERDPELEVRIDEIIDWIAAAQGEDGYLNTYYTLVKPDRRWMEIDHGHELYCAGHLIEAAVAYRRATGKEKLLEVAARFADCIDREFGPGKRQDPPGHEELELALVKLAEECGEERYAKLAAFFLDRRGQAEGRERLFGEYCQDHRPVREQERVVGHAVRAMYLYSGMADVARHTGDASLLDPLLRIWDDVTRHQMYVTGGIGSSASNEGFTRPFDLPNDTAYCETCAAIGMGLWNHRMALLTREARFADLMERELYNNVLSGVSLSGDRFFYQNPLGSKGDRERVPWFDCSCCPTNVVRYVPGVGGRVYARDEGTVYVLLYVQSSAVIGSGRTPVARIRQRTDYPWSGKVEIEAETSGPVHLRIPDWCEEPRVLEKNGEMRTHEGLAGQWLLHWVPEGVGTHRIRLDLAMEPRRVHADERVAADRGRVALRYGPMIYALEGIDHGGHARNLVLPPEAELSAEWREDLLGGCVVLRAEGIAVDEVDGEVVETPTELTAIPYCLWNNREKGEMVVWIPESAELAELPGEAGKARQGGAVLSASHTWGGDSLLALNDGELPEQSDDHSLPRHTFWDHKGTAEWLQYGWRGERELSRSRVYWFDDTGRGGCRVPQAWRLLVRAGDDWREVRLLEGQAFTTKLDAFNEVLFEPVATDAIRMEVRLREGFSGGVLEWEVGTAE